MDYNTWIEREKKIRLKILNQSPIIQQSGMYRVCQKCDEICLCHEDQCPNCNSDNIAKKELTHDNSFLEKFIRCAYRYQHLKFDD